MVLVGSHNFSYHLLIFYVIFHVNDFLQNEREPYRKAKTYILLNTIEPTYHLSCLIAWLKSLLSHVVGTFSFHTKFILLY